MSALKALAVGILMWAALSSESRADPITWPNNINWVAYFAGQNGNGGAPAAPATFAPASTATVLSNQPAAPQPQPQPPAPAPVQTVLANAPVPQVPAPISAPVSSAPSTPTPSGPVNAFINLGAGPYPLASTITAGGAQPWYDSSQITTLFGGQPNAQQIQSFDSAIMQRVQQTFSQSGVAVTLTDNPNVSAQHTLSLVSNTSSLTMNSAIGMTQVAGSGFSFLDKIAPSAQSVDQLEWIVAHNISHELMLAFGVPENYDQSGNFIDSKLANWSMMVSPTSTFSPAAAQALTQALSSLNTTSPGSQLGAQGFNGESVPEPTTIALWALAGTALVLYRRARSTQQPVAWS